MSYLPVTPAVRDRANKRLAEFAARGFVPDVEQVVRTAKTPDGPTERDGRYYFACRTCECETEWEGDPEEFDFDNHANVCGGSPRCIP